MRGYDLWLSPFDIWKATDLIVTVFVVGFIAFAMDAVITFLSLCNGRGHNAAKLHRSATHSERCYNFEDGASKPFKVRFDNKQSPSKTRPFNHSERC